MKKLRYHQESYNLAVNGQSGKTNVGLWDFAMLDSLLSFWVLTLDTDPAYLAIITLPSERFLANSCKIITCIFKQLHHFCLLYLQNCVIYLRPSSDNLAKFFNVMPVVTSPPIWYLKSSDQLVVTLRLSLMLNFIVNMSGFRLTYKIHLCAYICECVPREV